MPPGNHPLDCLARFAEQVRVARRRDPVGRVEIISRERVALPQQVAIGKFSLRQIKASQIPDWLPEASPAKSPTLGPGLARLALPPTTSEAFAGLCRPALLRSLVVLLQRSGAPALVLEACWYRT